MGGKLVPYFIESLSLLNNKAVVSFMDVDDIEKPNHLLKGIVSTHFDAA